MKKTARKQTSILREMLERKKQADKTAKAYLAHNKKNKKKFRPNDDFLRGLTV